MHYIDTSILTAYYCPEPRSARVQRLLTKLDGPTISPLVEVELHCAISRKVRAGELDPTDAHRIFAQFQAHLSEPRYHLVPIGAAEYTLARDWIAQLAAALPPPPTPSASSPPTAPSPDAPSSLVSPTSSSRETHRHRALPIRPQ